MRNTTTQSLTRDKNTFEALVVMDEDPKPNVPNDIPMLEQIQYVK